MLQYSVTEMVWVFFAFGDVVFWGTVGERVCRSVQCLSRTGLIILYVYMVVQV
jgi:hypothetical protein